MKINLEEILKGSPWAKLDSESPVTIIGRPVIDEKCGIVTYGLNAAIGKRPSLYVYPSYPSRHGPSEGGHDVAGQYVLQLEETTSGVRISKISGSFGMFLSADENELRQLVESYATKAKGSFKIDVQEGNLYFEITDLGTVVRQNAPKPTMSGRPYNSHSRIVDLSMGRDAK